MDAAAVAVAAPRAVVSAKPVAKADAVAVTALAKDARWKDANRVQKAEAMVAGVKSVAKHVVKHAAKVAQSLAARAVAKRAVKVAGAMSAATAAVRPHRWRAQRQPNW